MNNSVNRYKAGQKKKNIFNNTKFEDVEKRLSCSSLEDDDDDSLVLQYETKRGDDKNKSHYIDEDSEINRKSFGVDINFNPFVGSKKSSNNRYLKNSSNVMHDSFSDHTFESTLNEFNIEYALTLLEKFQEMDEEKDWESKINDPKAKLWISKRGSFINENMPFIHAEMIFEEKYNIDDIIECINNTEIRAKWDENIYSYQTLQNLNLNEDIVHIVYNDVSIAVTSRDFIEK